jgi:beta-lactam-binding protein with PASTA domain
VGISKVKGLTEEEAQKRLNSEGYNELPSKEEEHFNNCF